MGDNNDASKHTVIPEILPKAGLVYSEKGNLSEVLCKPKIMPIKSGTLEQIEQMEKEFQEYATQQRPGSDEVDRPAD
eukprot:CAMPEP_0178421404 /NCGR_PEP_ID=MMETSP0689_2-20121128/26629_1 /TAXON_ID=160604 /ORGANISM="Amphidinium massartii, Strain CS-259" /LENGTH=76 /DNA_ID=CAMNT_0020042913 /DNA_START=109 /DNA_END=337 /DNA_ORIENTATION=+